MLSDLNLPDIDQLLALSPKPSLWKSHTKKHLAIKEYLTFLDSCEDNCISSCDKIALNRPVPHWSATVGDPKLTRLKVTGYTFMNEHEQKVLV